MDYLIILENDETLYNWVTKTNFKILIDGISFGLYKETERLQIRSLNDCTFEFNFVIQIKKYFINDLQCFLKTLKTSDYHHFRQFNESDKDIIGWSKVPGPDTSTGPSITKTLVLPLFTVSYKGKYITV